MTETPLKRCSKCKERKTHSAFSGSGSSSDGLRSQCKECVKLPALKPRGPRKAKPPVADGNKWCPTCETERAQSEFGNRPRASDGLRSQCKICEREYAESRSSSIPTPADGAPRLCTGPCGETKTTADFGNNKQSPDGVNNKCKVCTRAYHSEWSEKNIEHVEEYRQTYYVENRDALLEQKKDYHERNREQRCARQREYATANREEINQKARERYEATKASGVWLAANARRRARVRNADCGDVTASWMTEQLDANDACPQCSTDFTYDDKYVPSYPNFDHIIPLNVGGLHRRSNLRLLCRDCNNRRPRDGRDVHITNEWAIQAALDNIEVFA